MWISSVGALTISIILVIPGELSIQCASMIIETKYWDWVTMQYCTVLSDWQKYEIEFVSVGC